MLHTASLLLHLRACRAGCSVQARCACRPHPLLRLLGLARERSWEQIEACEVSCMAACLVAKQPACRKHAAEFCEPPFSGPVAGTATAAARR